MDGDTAGLVKSLLSVGSTLIRYGSIYAPAFNIVLAHATQNLKEKAEGQGKATGRNKARFEISLPACLSLLGVADHPSKANK